jgi:hypothetical protein
MKSKNLLLICLNLAFAVIRAQNLTLPIDFPISLAGNYAELRKNHFHMGLDFRTDNKENLRIIAVEDGYISRMVIAPNGYGKAIYIHHPQQGFTSVYAHLNAFRPDMEWWINQVQYARQLNAIDTSFAQAKFFVKKGEHIAFSGNTGSSEGPHLHFEIRNLQTEKTINPLHFYPQIKDTIAPSLNKIIFYHVDGESIFIDKFSAKEISQQTVELNSSNIGLAISTFDKMNQSLNVFGIYALRVYVENERIYQFKLDSLDFNWQSHIRAASDYGIGENDVYKAFYESCSFNLTDSVSANGIIHILPKEKKQVRIEVYDFHGNTSSVEFFLTSTDEFKPDQSKAIDCRQEQILTDQKSFQLLIPANGLAENYALNYTLEKLASYELFKINLLNPSVAALMPFQLSYFVPPATKYIHKLYLESKIDNKMKCYTGFLQQNILIFPKLKNYGTLTIRYDHAAPEVIGLPLRRQLYLVFTVKDKESGIEDYRLYINGMWRKLYFDEKNNELIYKIISEDKGKKVKALLEVTDRVGNKNSKSFEILL